MTDWVGGDREGLTTEDLDRRFSPTSLCRRVDGRIVEQVSWNSWGAFYRRFDDQGEVVESRRATTADYDAANRWTEEEFARRRAARARDRASTDVGSPIEGPTEGHR